MTRRRTPIQISNYCEYYNRALLVRGSSTLLTTLSVQLVSEYVDGVATQEISPPAEPYVPRLPGTQPS